MLFSMNNQLLSIILSVLVYIDPGTGSIILQAIVATFVGAAVAAKIYWHKILKFLGIRKKYPKRNEDNPAGPPEMQ